MKTLHHLNAFVLLALFAPAGYAGNSPQTLVSNQTIEGSLDASDEADPKLPHLRRDRYLYHARAGEVKTFRLRDSQHDDPFFQMDGASTGLSKPSKGVKDLNVFFPKDGVYELSISAESGKYSVSAIPRQSSSESVPVRRLAVNDTLRLSDGPDASISDMGWLANVFSIPMKKGERIVLLATNRAVFRVLGPRRSNVRYLSAVNYEQNLFSTEITASEDGDHRVEVLLWPSFPVGTLKVASYSEGSAAVSNAKEAAQRQAADTKAKVDAALRRGDELLKSGSYEAAQLAYEEAIKLDSLNVRALTGAGLAAYNRGDTFAASINFTALASVDPGNQLAKQALQNLRDAETARERDAQRAAQAYQESRRRENANLLASTIGAFASGYQAGSAVESARVQAQTGAGAATQSLALPTNSVQGPVASEAPASSAPAAGSLASAYGDKSKFMNEETGRPCVTPGRYYTEARSDGTNYRWEFQNTCGRSFVVWTKSEMVDPSASPVQSNGILPGSPQNPYTMTMTCVNSSYNPRGSCKGYVSYDVR